MITVVRLKSNEDVICDLKEVYENELPENRPIAYSLEKPYVVTILQSITGEYVTEEGELSVRFTPWVPLSDSENFYIPCNYVVTTYEPSEWIKNSYLKNTEKK